MPALSVLREGRVVAPLAPPLLKAARAQVRQQGCRGLTLPTDRANEAAQPCHARRGFAASPMRPLRLPL